MGSAHVDKIFQIEGGCVAQYEYEAIAWSDEWFENLDDDGDQKEMPPKEPDQEFKGWADGWYWQHRRIHSSEAFEGGMGMPFGPLSGPFTSEDEARKHMLNNTDRIGTGRLNVAHSR